MNKQEAIKLIEQMGEYERFVDEPISKGSVLNIISKIHEPQKVVVPKFVAEWMEMHKKTFPEASAIDMYETLTLDNRNGSYHDVWLWAVYHHYDFIRAWHEGFEVEREQLYTIEIPDPNSRYDYTYLSKNSKGTYINTSNDMGWKQEKKNQLTESEIKQDFEWAWNAGFAKEVEANND